MSKNEILLYIKHHTCIMPNHNRKLVELFHVQSSGSWKSHGGIQTLQDFSHILSLNFELL